MKKPYSRAYARYQHRRKALRHKRITEYYEYFREYPYYPYFNMYDGKIHCSCGMCSRWSKTNNKAPKHRRIHANYAPSYNPSIHDRKRLESMDDSEEEYFEFVKKI